ncbi:MAG: hypothetical protein NTX63_02790 [Candidatus Peregrinibacteria bacterium]|nr:hypothetical protein [Candidatus Peregrinibacteria bacterium]
MIDSQKIFEHIIELLDANFVDYKLFSHRAALTYEDLAAVQQEAGFVGTEGKCMVMKIDDRFIVYITLQGKKVNFDKIKEVLNVKKVRLASKEELLEHFGAEPGCAYPFGFDAVYDLFVDPAVFKQEWFLFSPLFSTKTVQAQGSDLQKLFHGLPNKVMEVMDWNV